ncbi:MAG: tRNA-dihydrouridine synthase [Lentisphaerae bacterium]|nr:tRNA-dihydrouridine synthase [Lentisphaerota bacterium]
MREPLSIGRLRLDTPVLLAPMAGYTDLAFRLAVRRRGGVGLAFSEMISPRSLLQERGKRIRALLATSPEDSPLGFQLYGSEPALMADAAKRLVELGAALIDINMGCPKRKIVRNGSGASLLARPETAVAVAREVAAAVNVPVTAKIRLGLKENTVASGTFLDDLAESGIAALTVHGRTGEQGYSGRADWAGIREVVERVRPLTVIGNGDVTSPETAADLMAATGCRGIMIGRGALKDPWLPRDVACALAGEPAPDRPSRAERLELMRWHFEETLAACGAEKGVIVFRKWIPLYARKLNVKRPEMVLMLKIKGRAELERAFDALANAG